MNFLHPELFYLALPLVIAVAALSIHAAVRRREQLQNLLGSRADDPDAVHLSRHRRVVRIILLLIAMLCLLTAAARPWYGSRLLPYQQSGRDVMVLFDVSRSMLANDLPPSRLEHAKFLLRELIRNSQGDRFGIVPFAGNAFLLCPLTSDAVALDQYINELNPDSVPLGGTNLERALFQSAKAFEAASGSNRAVVLFTDGEELSGDSKRTIENLKKANIPLFIVGLGDPDTATPLPDKNGTLRRDSSGKLITSKLNESALKKLAQETGGIYVRSSVADTGIAAIQRRISQLGTAENSIGKRTLPMEKFHWFLIAGALFLFAYMILSERPAAVRKAAGIWLLCCFAASLSAEDALPKKPEAVKLPENPVLLYNYARERQLANGNDAQSLYEKVIQSAPNQPELQARTFGNLGITFHQAARKDLTAAEQKVSAQQLDAALQELQKAESQVKNAGELYTQSLSFGSPDALDGRNIQQLDNDRKKIEELKKKIEELKKQQQQAQQQTKQAQQQNKQQKQNQQQAQQQTQKAQQSAENLQKQAEGLKQQQLADQAKKAREELQKAAKAQQENKPQEAQKHLDNAAKALGADQSQKQPESKSQPQQKQDGKEQQQKPQPQPEKNTGDMDKKSAEQMLQMMKEAEDKRREDVEKFNLRRRRQQQVDKDW